VRVDSARKSNDFPGSHWCNTCWPQLKSTTVSRICVAPGTNHEFDVSRFYYESQGRILPRKCLKHRGRDKTVSMAAVAGGNLFNRLVGVTRPGSVSGKDW
jgi:hypothetical protein